MTILEYLSLRIRDSRLKRKISSSKLFKRLYVATSVVATKVHSVNTQKCLIVHYFIPKDDLLYLH